MLTLDYFSSILSSFRNRKVCTQLSNWFPCHRLTIFPHSQVFIITVPQLYSSHVVKSLIHRFSARIYAGTPSDDWSLAVNARTFIGSFGTFSWMVAFLSEGDTIHLPYISELEYGAWWVPWHDLFIHDDARIIYHDVSNVHKPTHETPSDVIHKNSPFAKSLKSRNNPCAHLKK